jgi:hypothetical protein
MTKKQGAQIYQLVNGRRNYLRAFQALPVSHPHPRYHTCERMAQQSFAITVRHATKGNIRTQRHSDVCLSATFARAAAPLLCLAAHYMCCGGQTANLLLACKAWSWLGGLLRQKDRPDTDLNCFLQTPTPKSGPSSRTDYPGSRAAKLIPNSACMK